ESQATFFACRFAFYPALCYIFFVSEAFRVAVRPHLSTFIFQGPPATSCCCSFLVAAADGPALPGTAGQGGSRLLGIISSHLSRSHGLKYRFFLPPSWRRRRRCRVWIIRKLSGRASRGRAGLLRRHLWPAWHSRRADS